MKASVIKFMFSSGKRLKTWRKMAVMLKYGHTVGQVLLQFRNRYMERKSALAQVFESISKEMDKGQALDKACEPWIPQEEMMLIRAGVQSGKVPEALQDCAGLIEAKSKIMQSLIGAVAYPCFLVAMLVAFVLFLAFFVIPEISTLSSPETWQGSARLLYTVTNFVASPFGVLLFILAAILAALTVATLPTWTGPLRLRVENLPPWSVYRLVTGSVWLFTLATLLRGGIQLETVLNDMLGSGVMRPWLAERVAAVKDRYRSEDNLGQILLHLGMHFPDDEMVEDLVVYAALPNFHSRLYDIAREWLDDGIQRINRMSKILNGVLLLSILSTAGWMTVAIRSLQQQLTTGMGGF